MPAFLTALLPQLFSLFAGAFGIDTTSEETKVKLAELELQSQQMISDQLTGQLKIDESEAAAPGRTWPTWREIVGYTCAAAFAYHFVIQQVLSFLCNAAGHPVPLPELEMSELMTVLLGMLGLGSLDAGQHLINSRFNSPPGQMPDTKKPPAGRTPGRLVDGVWVED